MFSVSSLSLGPGAEPSPALLVSSCSRKRVRKSSKDAGTKPEEAAPKIKGKPGRKPKPKPGGEVPPVASAGKELFSRRQRQRFVDFLKADF